ncbi:MAG: DegT/DnrJ/EryC1/StrS aminotransferase [Candidatus Magasanikbacteria bacterium GW2011_GWE2_42_7]|uniref:DegT/DnrJ/EryC1/StrS aminotransferase n=1 Tax=Candidatus Magasanikbacteria bacterium GW2011_GWE2_42_7 TaxID=1619052 RepID=A0A0G1BIH8_9BACT|nr:MAG: DegT/DnrJ/EryC1/StrS aminotransferase [Candidatus Magasanikbacteria bacterium GW2011_GWE2_42_7]
MKKTIFTGFSPNTRAKDMSIAASFLFLPWKWFQWKKGTHEKRAMELLEGYFGENIQAITYDSGRSALYHALLALDVGEGDEVLVQAFTCMVVINAICWTGARPVYVDIEKDTLNMDPVKADHACSDKTKVIILQHTFGLPANIDALLDVAKKHNLKTIEDCAHSLGARYKGKLTGTYADIGMLSFGGEKIVSCVRGGALITKLPQLAVRLRKTHATLSPSTRRVIRQHLLHVVLFPMGKSLYHLGIGKVFLKVLKELHITNKIIYTEEKYGKQVAWYPSKLPNALSALLVSQLPEIESMNLHRRHIASLYKKKLPHVIETQQDTDMHIYLRFSLFVQNPNAVRDLAKKQGILLGDWYSLVIGPGDVDLSVAQYVKGTCPIAEERAAKALNLPTDIHIQDSDVLRILSVLTE